MKFLKKHIKTIGTCITVLALIFVVKKLITMDVDYSSLANIKTISIIAICTILQTFMFVFMTLPWLVLTRIISQKKIPFYRAMPVFTKSNLLKYVPGNVFQYVGRNQLASDMNIRHADVAFATILDIIFCVIVPFLLAIILLGRHILKLINEYGSRFLIIFIIAVAIILISAVIIKLKFSEKVLSFINPYRSLLCKKTILKLVYASILYLIQYIIFCLVSLLPAVFLLDIPIEKCSIFVGTYLFSWILGFITPGAPGGIGIREAAMIFMCGSFADNDVIMIYTVILRLVSIFGDIIAFLCGVVCNSFIKKHHLNNI